MVAGKNADTLALTEGLAADAAGILERDYGIDAGEVLSMNVDTVETVQSESKVDASDAATILGLAGSASEWWSSSTWGFSRGALSGTFTSFTQTDPSDAFEVADVNGKSRVRAKTALSAFRTFKNEPSYFTNPTKAEYHATFGTEGGMSVHGEAWYWFKLNRDNTKGWAVVSDNHTACGPFSNADHALYLVKLEGNTYSVMSGYTAELTMYESAPEYAITIKEEDGIANINIHPNNSVSTINGGTADLNWNGINVRMDEEATQAFSIYYYAGSYFQDVSSSVEATVVKAFGDIVYEPNWTDGALHMLINMDTKSDSTMLGRDNGTESSYLVSSKRFLPSPPNDDLAIS